MVRLDTVAPWYRSIPEKPNRRALKNNHEIIENRPESDQNPSPDASFTQPGLGEKSNVEHENGDDDQVVGYPPCELMGHDSLKTAQCHQQANKTHDFNHCCADLCNELQFISAHFRGV